MSALPRELQRIAGVDRPGRAGRWWTVHDPATSAPLFEIPWGDADDARDALDAAAAAQPAWAARPAHDRAALLERAADLLAARADAYARRTTAESGKPLAQARGEWLSAPTYLRQAADELRRLGGRWIPARAPGRRIDVTYRPLGVVGVITAWNFPVYNVNRACASALAAGCAVVVRPSEHTPRSALDYARALEDAGLPPGVLNVITGDPEPQADRLLADPRCRKIAFTGSTRVGRLLLEGSARNITRLALELGGNAPVLIFPDAVDPRDPAALAAFARAAVTARHRNAGQVCIAPQRFYLHRDLYEPLLAALADAVRAEVVGPGDDPATTVGPLINERQRRRVHAIVEASVAAGARLLVGGHPLPGPGTFYAPTLLADVPDGAPILTEEVFGPVTPVLPFDDEDDALARANATEYGLAAFLFTRDLARALRVSERLDFGMIGVGDWYPVAAEAPFGGLGLSGLGRESGAEGLLEYLEVRTRYFGGLA